MTGGDRTKDKPHSRAPLHWSSWDHVEIQLGIGETPDPWEIEFLLFSQNMMPPYLTRRYIADMVHGRKRDAQRPKRPDFILEIERWRKAEEFTKAIRALWRRHDTLAKACVAYAETHGIEISSIARKYWAAVEVCKRNRAEWRGHFNDLPRGQQLILFKQFLRDGTFWDMAIDVASMFHYRESSRERSRGFSRSPYVRNK
jgi:hypothetical protein